ncbi:hypothetical protein L596_016556 [Steinernema carpocapsae]|uniref:Uncharacterized protein n=1 Tax=Steinernema carpocapsae TaxID=34508 RepID=A0A4U5NJ66_STECR|nr:hypothetical protein L596_016556 [Steinernema carpocapsae]
MERKSDNVMGIICFVCFLAAGVIIADSNTHKLQKIFARTSGRDDRDSDLRRHPSLRGSRRLHVLKLDWLRFHDPALLHDHRSCPDLSLFDCDRLCEALSTIGAEMDALL